MSERTIYEPAREIPVALEGDVVVAGAGLAGSAAALATDSGGSPRMLE